MDLETLKKANRLDRKINILHGALTCFEWSFTEDDTIEKVSTNPSIIIEFDDVDGRSQVALPYKLSENLIGLLKQEILTQITIAEKEFKAL